MCLLIYMPVLSEGVTECVFDQMHVILTPALPETDYFLIVLFITKAVVGDFGVFARAHMAARKCREMYIMKQRANNCLENPDCGPICLEIV